MKRSLLTLIVAFMPSLLFCQTTQKEYLDRYNTLSARMGADGVGIETLLEKWEADFPEDLNMLNAKISFFLLKSQSFEVIQKDQSRYLGSKPLMTLKDSLGVSHNYFRDVIFDDDYFSEANKLMDKAINLNPMELQLRSDKLSMLLAYEKENPDMVSQSLMSIIDYNYSSHPSWKMNGIPATEEDFINMVQDNCFYLFSIGSPSSYEAFRKISEKMLAYNPKNITFLSNMGSYYLSSAKEPKTAVKYYSKVLKQDPSNYPAAKNCYLACRQTKDVKGMKKYLQILAESAPDEMERQSFRTQLEALVK